MEEGTFEDFGRMEHLVFIDGCRVHPNDGEAEEAKHVGDEALTAGEGVGVTLGVVVGVHFEGAEVAVEV